MAMVTLSLSCPLHSSLHTHQNSPNPNTFPLTISLSKPFHSTQTHSTLSTIQPHNSSQQHLNSAFHLLQTQPTQEQAHSINTLLQECGQTKNLDIGRKIHEFVANSNSFQEDYVINTRLITMYCMCESPLDARNVFDEIPEKNLYRWNAIISGYTRNELCFEALLLFCELIMKTGFKPNNYTFPSVIKACGGILCLEIGRVVHGMGLKMGFGEDAYVCNALIAMYGRCGHVEEMVKVFDEMPERTVVSWNAMVFGYSECGLVDDSLAVFREMLASDDCLPLDAASLVTVLPVCAGKGDVEMGKVVHGLALRLGFHDELTVKNALVDMYAKCGCILGAQTLFSNCVNKNVVSWNVMILGYSREGDVQRAFDLLRQMQVEGVGRIKANAITILNVLSACSDQSKVRSLKELHGYAFRNGFQNDELVAGAFVSTYAKCGSLCSADHGFYSMEIMAASY